MTNPNTAFANAMNLKQVRRAIGLAEVNLGGLEPEARKNMELMLEALRERERRLLWTKRIHKAQ